MISEDSSRSLMLLRFTFCFASGIEVTILTFEFVPAVYLSYCVQANFSERTNSKHYYHALHTVME